jgi:hypothetical protein
LCHRCTDACAELQSAIAASRAKGTSKISIAGNSFAKALKSVWSDKRIKELRDQLEEIRSQMIITTLISVW